LPFLLVLISSRPGSGGVGYDYRDTFSTDSLKLSCNRTASADCFRNGGCISTAFASYTENGRYK
jgi:hypothetical protein